jgi:5-methylcytosine-specific restriction endonuclease McrA
LDRRLYLAKWREKNREKLRARQKLWYVNNPSACRAYNKKWRENNKVKYLAKSRRNAAERRARKLQATVPWADKVIINHIYSLAVAQSFLTGEPWAVDHIIPLKAPNVCGLHTEQNLRVICKSENLRKGNRFSC